MIKALFTRSFFGFVTLAFILAASGCKSKTKNPDNVASGATVKQVDFGAAVKALRNSETPSAVIFGTALKTTLAKQNEISELYIPQFSVEQHFCIDKTATESIYKSARSLGEMAQTMSTRLSQALNGCVGEAACFELGGVQHALEDVSMHMATANQHVEAYQIGADMGGHTGDINASISAAQRELEDWIVSHNAPVDTIYEVYVDGLGMVRRLLEQEAQSAHRKAWEGAPFADDIDALLTDLTANFGAIETFARRRNELEVGTSEAYGAVVSEKLVDILALLEALEAVSATADNARTNCGDDMILQIGRTAGLLNNLETSINACLAVGTCLVVDAETSSVPVKAETETASQPLPDRLNTATAEMKRAIKG